VLPARIFKLGPQYFGGSIFAEETLSVSELSPVPRGARPVIAGLWTLDGALQIGLDGQAHPAVRGSAREHRCDGFIVA
jgi:hypothetical protein